MIIERIAQISLITLFTVLSLPIHLKYSSISLIFCALSISLVVFKKDLKQIKFKDPFIILCFMFFLTTAIRNILCLDFENSFIKDVKLSFIIIPFLFLNSAEFLKKNLSLIFGSYVLGVVAYTVYAWGFAFYFYYIKYPEFYQFSLTDGYLRYMFYNYLPGAIHHTYIGMYMSFAIAILFIYTIMKRKVNKLLGISLMLFLFFSMIYVGSKLSILIIVVFIFACIARRVKFKKLLLLIFSCVFVLASFLFVNKKDRILNSINNSLESRVEIYSCGIKAYQDNIFFGLGNMNLENYCPEYEKFVPHNIFLRELLYTGIIGGVVLILLVLYLLKSVKKSRNVLFLLLFAKLVAIGFIEDVLYIQRGVFFFVLFSSLFYSFYKRDITLNKLS